MCPRTENEHCENKRLPADLSVVIPVYNSEATIERVVSELSRELTNRYDYHIILVDDGSSDGSYKMCRRLAEVDRRVRLISFFRNFGQLSAIMAGLRIASGNIVVVMDDDLQNPPSEIHKLITAINQDCDFVFGASQAVAKQSLFRRLGSSINSKLNEIVFQKPRGIRVTSYYALSQALVREIIKYEGPFPYISGFIFRTTLRGRNVFVEHRAREHGRSGYNVFRLIKLSLNGLTNFSIFPLRISTYFGFLTSIFGFVMLLVVLFHWIFESRTLQGWTSTIGSVLFFCGIQLLSMGMLGEYVGRVFLTANRAPQSAIRETYNCPDIGMERR